MIPPTTPFPFRLAPVLLSLAALVGLVACETPLERGYGRSQREHLARSIENPEAGQKDASVASDGASTDNALAKHREREQQVEESEPKSVITINAGN